MTEQDPLISGRSVVQFENEDVYDGEWKDEKMDGEGLYLYVESGNHYAGQWKAHRKSGMGAFFYKVSWC